LNKAKASNADIFITSDYKYHDFFDAENRIIIADIGHYESEQFTTELIADLLKEKNITFAVRFAETNTNPVKYF
jgi:putative NIF3 family GTP cyclohydrolase 1 type 2